MENNIFQHPRRKYDFIGSSTDEKVIDSSIDDVSGKETRLHPLVEEVNESSVVCLKEVTEKKVAVNSSGIGHELWQRTDII